MKAFETNTLDNIIERLLEVRGKKVGTEVKLTETDVKFLLTKCKEIFSRQSILLDLIAPLTILGDIHGQYFDLLRLFEHGGYPPKTNYLFLGDYVDRGKQSIETICLLMALKIKYPENFFILRGNHEAETVNRLYGFYDECRRRYNMKLFKQFTDLFNWMPVAATIDDKIFCVHGGLSPDLKKIDQIAKLNRPTEVPSFGLLCDILWSDPSNEVETWDENDRGVSYVFSKGVLNDFMKVNDLDLIVRAHQVAENGYEFFGERKLVTVFSAPDYCGEFTNSAGMMLVNEDLHCSFKVLKPFSEQSQANPVATVNSREKEMINKMDKIDKPTSSSSSNRNGNQTSNNISSNVLIIKQQIKKDEETIQYN